MQQPTVYPIQAGKLYQGTIVKNDDPKKRSRVKVQVTMLTDGISEDNLPWYVILPVAGASNNQCLSVPTLQSTVFVSFPDADIYNGVVEYVFSDIEGNQ